MTGSTVPDEFKFETKNDQPGVTLRREAGTTLAEQVQAKFNSQADLIADLTARVAALETGVGGVGWIPIDEGDTSGATFSIDLTSGGLFPDPPLWSVIKVFARIDLNDVGRVTLRANGDANNIYTSSGVPIDSLGNIDLDQVFHYADASSWRVGHFSDVSTCNLELTLIFTGGNPGLVNFQSTSHRQSATSSVDRHMSAAGALTSGNALTLTSLEFGVDPDTVATSFTDVWWQAVGLRMVAP